MSTERSVPVRARDLSAVCVVGCVARRQHVADCAGVDATCTGCVPSLATHGILCGRCWHHLRTDVAQAPALVRHLRSMAIQTAGAKPPSDGRGGQDPAETSLLSEAVDAADGVHAALAAWALVILEEHPSGSRMTGPDVRGMWVSDSGDVVGFREPQQRPREWFEARRTAPMTDSAGEPIEYVVRGLLPAAPAPDPAAATVRLAAWLSPFLPWCSEQSWAGVMREELGSLRGQALARWPA